MTPPARKETIMALYAALLYYVKNVGVTDQGWSEPSSEVRCNTQIVTDYARRAISTW
jgi:hypothetical protein